MKIIKKQYIICLAIITVYTGSCVEPFEIETMTFEDALVIEATITNELKYQNINLTRTFEFEEDGPSAETNATVKIVDDVQNIYNFEETTPGKYISTSVFSAVSNRTYQLTINTSNGRVYTSQPIQLTQITQISDIVALRNTDDIDRVSIYVNSFDPSGNSRYYRYEYEETYIIVPPFFSPLDVIILSDVPPFTVNTSVTTAPRAQEERFCFNTLFNNNIIQTQTTSLFEDRVSQFPIHSISRNNPILRDRYSILVKQYVQSLEAFTYYKVLNELSGSESILSQNQPGFINGNLTSIDNPDEKVLGFFEIASVSSKRLFFNYRDIFPDGNRPFYFAKCGTEDLESPLLVDENDPNISPLINKIISDTIKHFETNFDFFGEIDEKQPYRMTNRACGDCTVFGTNIKPDFWVD